MFLFRLTLIWLNTFDLTIWNESVINFFQFSNVWIKSSEWSYMLTLPRSVTRRRTVLLFSFQEEEGKKKKQRLVLFLLNFISFGNLFFFLLNFISFGTLFFRSGFLISLQFKVQIIMTKYHSSMTFIYIYINSSCMILLAKFKGKAITLE